MLDAAPPLPVFCCFFFNDTATTEIYTLSLHDALPISHVETVSRSRRRRPDRARPSRSSSRDRKITRLNSSHLGNSYAVFCLKKKKIRDDRAARHTKELPHDNCYTREQRVLQRVPEDRFCARDTRRERRRDVKLVRLLGQRHADHAREDRRERQPH